MFETWALVVWFVLGSTLPTPASTVSEFLSHDDCKRAGELFVKNAPQANGASFGIQPTARFVCLPKGLYKIPTYTN